MIKTTRLAVLLTMLVLAGCSTPYQEDSFLSSFVPFRQQGGYRVTQAVDAMRKPIEGVWRVRFEGNLNTTAETVRTYGLYRCATFTLEQGFDGFEMLPQQQMSLAPTNPLFHRAQVILVPVPVTVFTAEIRLLKKPFVANPPRIFDAVALKAALEPHVMGEKCEGNVCPHTPDYLMPNPLAEPETPPV